jgi:hypothetical protein
MEAIWAATTPTAFLLVPSAPIVPSAHETEAPSLGAGPTDPISPAFETTDLDAVPPVEFAPEPAAAPPAAEPAAERPAEPAVIEPATRRRRRRAGETAPDDLLHPPTSVDSAANDFFDGLVRRVNGDL